MDASSSADEYEVLAKPKGKSESTTYLTILLLILFDIESMVNVVLAPNLESDSATEASSDNKPKTDDSVTESSEDEGLVGNHSSVMHQLQYEVRVSHKAC